MMSDVTAGRVGVGFGSAAARTRLLQAGSTVRSILATYCTYWHTAYQYVSVPCSYGSYVSKMVHWRHQEPLCDLMWVNIQKELW
jgi:hypothetical protein